MAIFLDTGNLDEIKKFYQMGLIRGVTTNPTILVKEGVKGGMRGVRDRSIQIAEIINPYPLSVEVTNNDEKKMISEALEFSNWADNINVKITIHGPNGELENLRVIHSLENEHDIRINVTAMMSAQQCFLAAMAGATYISIFGGRINNMGYDSKDEIKKLRKILNDFSLNSKIIVGSTREIFNVIDWLHAGAHIVTVTPKILEGMIVHPYSKETVEMFLKDAEKFANS
ncbi:MAG: transaldolase [Candidatus Marinimicrobia bacterium]|nr:transaldolase [Candidatus Neomarinimicrobiota bacterium]|tara:strand:+ start:23397 stop:24080 length:684 start_codon:yes stop_codon:yes gene_type:complete